MDTVDNIRKTLETHLGDTIGIPSVAYENVPFDKTATTEYVNSNLIITSRRPSARGPNPLMRYQGIFQMDVCVPLFQGSGGALGYVGVLLERFNGSTDILGVSQTVSIEYSEPADPYKQDPFYRYPVQVAWYAYGQ